MRVTFLLCWVLALSWLTHFFASPSWRVIEPGQVLLTPTDALDTSSWKLKQTATALTVTGDNIEAPTETKANSSRDGKSLLLLRTTGKRGSAVRSLNLSGHASMLRLQVRLQAEPIVRESLRLFPPPAVYLKTTNVTGAHRYPLVERPMFFQRIHVIDEVVEFVRENSSVEVSLVGAPGSDWRVSDLRLSVVEEHWRYVHSFRALIALWGLTVLFVVVAAWQRARVSTVLVSIVLALVIFAVLASRSQITQGFRTFANGILSLGGSITKADFNAVMQYGHITLFALLTAVVLATHRRWALHPLQAIGGVLVVAVASEALQSHVLGRSPDAQDIVFDFIGVCLGGVFYLLVATLVTKISAKGRAI